MLSNDLDMRDHVQDLMPDDLRQSWHNNNRNKVHNKHNASESSWNHPLPNPGPWKNCLLETSPWCPKLWGPLAQSMCTDPEPRSGGQASGENGNRYQKGINNRSKYFSFLSAYLINGHFSHVWFFAILWTVALQAPLSMGFSMHEHWSGLPCPSPGDPPDPEIKLTSLMSPALARRFFITSTTVTTATLAYF